LLTIDDYKALAKTIKALNRSLTKLLIVVQTYRAFAKVHFLSSLSLIRSKRFLFPFRIFLVQAFSTYSARTFKAGGRTVFVTRRKTYQWSSIKDFTVNRKANLFSRKSTGNRLSEPFPV